MKQVKDLFRVDLEGLSPGHGYAPLDLGHGSVILPPPSRVIVQMSQGPLNARSGALWYVDEDALVFV